MTFDFEPSLSGTDSLVADGLLDLGAGLLDLSGSVDAYGGLVLGGATISGTTLNNHGAATWDLDFPSNTTLDAGAVINNLAGASFAIVGSGDVSRSLVAGDGTAVAFNNAGTLTSATGGTVNISVPFSNTGSVDVQQGDLGLGNASYADSYQHRIVHRRRRARTWRSATRTSPPSRRSPPPGRSRFTRASRPGATRRRGARSPPPPASPGRCSTWAARCSSSRRSASRRPPAGR